MAISPPDLASAPTIAPTDEGPRYADNLSRMRDPRVLAAELTIPLQQPIKPVRTPLLYKFWLLLAALTMITLPLIYMAMIAGVAWLIFLHAVEDIVIFEQVGSIKVAAFLYVTPILIGVLVLLFMIKPILAKPERAITPRALKPEDEPVLFEFVEALCKVVRAPRPRQICVDLRANASAGFIGGPFGVLLGRLRLTIGLPLVAGLNARQLTGVLAHELGHFGQGGGMRLTYIIKSISIWFARVAYDRDTWDAWLAESANSGGILGVIAINLARLFVWFTRQVLKVLMLVGRLLTSFLQRQMEFDADRYVMRVAGSETFEQMARRLPLIMAATNKAMHDTGTAWNERRLGDDFPLMIAHSLDHLPPEIHAKVDEHIEKVRGHLFDTHPTGRRRIARAKAANEPGIFTDERPGSILFRDYDALSRTVSMDFYAMKLGPLLANGRLIRSQELIRQRAGEDDAHEAAERFSFGTYRTYRPYHVHLGMIEATEDPRSVLEALKQARTYIASNHALTEAEYDLLDRLLLERLNASAAGAVLKSEACGSVELGGRRVKSVADATNYEREVQLQISEAEQAVGTVEQQLVRRLSLPIRLLRHPRVAERVENAAALINEAEKLVDAMRAHSDALNQIGSIHELFINLHALLKELPRKGEVLPALASRIRTLAGQLETTMRQTLTILNSAPYPFEHGHEAPTLAHFVFGDIPRREDIGRLMQTADEGLQRFDRVGHRAFGRLAQICEQVEQALGLPALPYAPQAAETA